MTYSSFICLSPDQRQQQQQEKQQQEQEQQGFDSWDLQINIE